MTWVQPAPEPPAARGALEREVQLDALVVELKIYARMLKIKNLEFVPQDAPEDR